MKRFGVIFLVVGLVVSSLSLSGCAGNKAQQGAGIGALGGGLVGSLVGRSKDRGRNALIGAALGGLLGYGVGNEMDKNDQLQVNQAYESNQDNQTTRWQNPNSGRQYAVTPLSTTQVDGRPCRRARIEAIIDGQPQSVVKMACRNPDGTWQI